MLRGVLAQLALVLLALAGYKFGGLGWAVAVAGSCVFIIAWCVTSPRSQVFVPTVWRASAHTRAVALTFDDGPDPEVTPRVLDLLRARQAKATFFMVGEAALQAPDVVARVLAEGHTIGTHSQRHAHTFHFARSRPMAREILEGARTLERLTGAWPRFFRPPQGLRVPTLRDALARVSAERGPLLVVTWSTRALDTTLRSPHAILRRLRAGAVAGAIFTLHDGRRYGGRADREAMLEALASFLDELTRRGLRPVTLEELLGGSAHSGPGEASR
jgi:peptidoglycan/xylan/chitin deacetylase (PgdA/CDA1 family)